jgi:hypothetical protein
VTVTTPTLAQVRRLAGQLAAAADEPGPAMTAALGSGQVLAQDQLHQEPGHDIGAESGS